MWGHEPIHEYFTRTPELVVPCLTLQLGCLECKLLVFSLSLHPSPVLMSGPSESENKAPQSLRASSPGAGRRTNLNDVELG